jgi:hypothetical protein
MWGQNCCFVFLIFKRNKNYIYKKEISKKSSCIAAHKNGIVFNPTISTTNGITSPLKQLPQWNFTNTRYTHKFHNKTTSNKRSVMLGFSGGLDRRQDNHPEAQPANQHGQHQQHQRRQASGPRKKGPAK